MGDPDGAEAARGPADPHVRTARELEDVRGLLLRGGGQDVVPIPWQGWPRTHGRSAVIGTLTRTERARDISAF